MTKKILYIFAFIFLLPFFSSGQQFPYYPTAYRIFSPAVFNPAFAGSRDISDISFTANINGTHDAQLLNGSTRLLKSKKNRWPAPDVSPFSNFGTGGYLFHEETDSLDNYGFAGSFSYHIPVSSDRVSYFSLGLTAKGALGIPVSNPEDPDTLEKAENIFTPDLDFGISYYSARFFAGISITNILTDPVSSGFPSKLQGVVSRQFLITTGYRIILSRKKAILLEPSILMNFGNAAFDNDILHYHPALKLYYKNSYIGWYLNDTKNLSFMMHLDLPWFFVSSYVEFPARGDVIWFNGNLNLELSVGIVLGRKHSVIKEYKYW